MPTLTLSLISAIALAATTAAYLWLDMPVAEAAYGVRETWLHGLARRLGRAGEIHWVLVPPILLALLWRKTHPGRAHKAAFVAAAVSGAGLLALLSKVIIGRTRPLLLMESGEHSVQFFQFSYDSMAFPSGHATTAFAAMTALALLFPKATLPLMGVAVLLAGARILAISHYLSDVTAGAWLGAATALVLAARMQPASAIKALP